MGNIETVALVFLKDFVDFEALQTNYINGIGVGFLLAYNDDRMFEQNVGFSYQNSGLVLANGLPFRLGGQIFGFLGDGIVFPNIIMKPIVVVSEKRIMVLDPV